MRDGILILSVLNILFILLHELDACYLGEWKMFGVLSRLKEQTQYLVFLYLHIPIILLCLFYMVAVIDSRWISIWLAVNLFSVFHLLIHIIAIRWRKNVFKSVHSFLFIAGAGLAGFLNLLLLSAY